MMRVLKCDDNSQQPSAPAGSREPDAQFQWHLQNDSSGTRFVPLDEYGGLTSHALSILVDVGRDALMS
eukprot:1261939-Pleurochrysis_carterae.AAC.4